MQEGREEKNSSRLGASAVGRCFRNDTQEPYARAIQIGVLEADDPLPNEFVPVSFVECVTRRCDPVNRPTLRSVCYQEFFHQTPIANKSPNQPRDCVCLGIGGASCLRLEFQFHREHDLGFSPLSECLLRAMAS
jgi:hypothetical protein